MYLISGNLRRIFLCKNSQKLILRNNLQNFFFVNYKYTRVSSFNYEKNVRFSFERVFHTTPRRNLGPIFWTVFTKSAKLVTIFGGRYFRNSWKKLTKNEKKEFCKTVKSYRLYISLFTLFSVLFLLISYYTHIYETPITKRKRFLAFTPKQCQRIAMVEYEEILSVVKDRILPSTNPAYKVIVETIQTLINSNQDLDLMRTQTWKVLIVDSNECNAFVLPTGHIFVYTGLLKLTQNVDQLATVIGHEMAHAVLSHSVEQISFAALLDFLVIFIMAVIWTLLPNDGIAVIFQWFQNKVIKVMLELPYQRSLEMEADEVGLIMCAKACYDVRSSSLFWNMINLKEKMKVSTNDKEAEIPQWLSTHPANDERASKIDELLPKVIKLRSECKCSPLSSEDPRDQIQVLKHILTDVQKEPK